MQSNLHTNQIPCPAPSGRFSIRARLRSVSYAAQGIVTLIREEHNARIHLFATGAVVLTGWRLHCTWDEWRWLLLAIGLVWMAEAFNTAIEVLCDLVQPGFHPQVKRIKDLAAGAVLLAALTAALIGMTVLWPHLAGSMA
ncbi:diacylglycerol kinase family protein [Novosphingobium terrae]|uniref:diacylglycerol kinase family protein n=1 Tax=Novosphingobium terrae TaxID=2726189 RepID=UPI001981886E|nr:diacylglycerol kinase family protein [Novosphingobium terrae]